MVPGCAGAEALLYDPSSFVAACQVPFLAVNTPGDAAANLTKGELRAARVLHHNTRCAGCSTEWQWPQLNLIGPRVGWRVWDSVE